jgi:hypothetical protein
MHSAYARLLDLARDQAEAVTRGDLDAAVNLLDVRAALLIDAPAPGAGDTDAIREVLRLDRDLSSAIRERMIELRDEVLDSRQGNKALSGYARRVQRQPMAVDRVS